MGRLRDAESLDVLAVGGAEPFGDENVQGLPIASPAGQPNMLAAAALKSVIRCPASMVMIASVTDAMMLANTSPFALMAGEPTGLAEGPALADGTGAVLRGGFRYAAWLRVFLAMWQSL